DEHLESDDEGEADSEQPAEVILSGEPDAHAARDEDEVEREDREQAGEAELLAEARDDVVALGERHDLRTSLAESGSDEAAVREPEQPLDELVAPAVRIVDIRVERVEPAVEARRDVSEEP